MVLNSKLSVMINGTIAGKFSNLERVLQELRSLGTLDEQSLPGDWMKLRAVERDLQIAVEILVDVCHRVLAAAGQAPATNSRDALERCQGLGAIQSAAKYRPLIGFRNLLVHRYEFVDVPILVDIVNHHLGDLDDFRREIEAYAARG